MPVSYRNFDRIRGAEEIGFFGTVPIYHYGTIVCIFLLLLLACTKPGMAASFATSATASFEECKGVASEDCDGEVAYSGNFTMDGPVLVVWETSEYY